MSNISEQEPSNTIGELKKVMSSEVGKAEGGSKIGTTPAEKEERSVKKSSFCEINLENDLKATILNLSKQIRELQQECSSTNFQADRENPLIKFVWQEVHCHH